MITGDYEVKNMWIDDDFYSEPSEFDEQVDEFKKSLRASVKEEILAEMDRLRKENEKLTDIRDRWNAKVRELENEYRKKQHDLDLKIRDAEKAIHEAKKMRLIELIADYPSYAYTVQIKYIKQPKCNQCDENRKIPYVSPRGQKLYEPCACSDMKRRYYVKRAPLIEIVEHRIGVLYPTYLVNTDEESSYLRNAHEFYDDIPFDEIKKKTISPLFRDESRAKRFVAWMNQMEWNE